MYAVINDRGKQYRVSEGDVLNIDYLSESEPGQPVEFSNILMLQGDSDTKMGTPHLAGAKVAAEVIGPELGQKILVFKMKRRKGYHRTNGHRQKYTRVRIKEIVG